MFFFPFFLGGREGQGAQNEERRKKQCTKILVEEILYFQLSGQKVHEKDQSGGKQTNYAHCKGFSSKKPFYLTLLLAKLVLQKMP
jgi:hypothetical protein